MAIDVQTKRRAAQAYGGSFIGPVADGGLVSAFDRAHMAWIYLPAPSGPFCVEAAQGVIAGAVASQGVIAGAVAAQVGC